MGRRSWLLVICLALIAVIAGSVLDSSAEAKPRTPWPHTSSCPPTGRRLRPTAAEPCVRHSECWLRLSSVSEAWWKR
jgi:hypothetical protein